MDLQSEWDCYRHIAPVKGQRVLQLGGSGKAVQALLLAGAAEALLLTPMLGEAQAAIETGSVRREDWGEGALLVTVTGWGQPSNKDQARRPASTIT
jgi:hypothetical protein